jgi:hypothetical protein
MVSRPARRTFAFIAAAGAVALPLFAAGAPAPPTGRVVLQLVGSESINARIYQSETRECHDLENAKVFEARIGPGATSLTVPGCCLCVQQTFAPWTSVGWTLGEIGCRFPGGKRGRKFCEPRDYAGTLEFTLRSRE